MDPTLSELNAMLDQIELMMTSRQRRNQEFTDRMHVIRTLIIDLRDDLQRDGWHLGQPGG